MPQNVRVFEQLDGLLTVTSLFRSRETNRDVKFRLTEFLYFYLTPETPPVAQKAGRDGSSPNGEAFKSPGRAGKKGGEKSGSGVTLSVEEKKQLVDRYLPGLVDELLRDLDTYKPFGGILS